MKQIITMITLIVITNLAIAQTNQLVWHNGNLLYGTSVKTIDSLTYGGMEDIDTLHLLLPRTLIKVEHDTIYVHDTLYIEVAIDDSNKVHEFVDLGLSVKWATCNIGATKPEEYGYYFAWGEVTPKEICKWENYIHSNGSHDNITKYCTQDNFGKDNFTDYKTILDAENDAAHVNWGGSWRMPTKEEKEELMEKCTWVLTTENGVNGYRVTSNVEGYTNQSIFLPSAGMIFEDAPCYVGDYGCYWTSSLDANNTYNAYYCAFSQTYNKLYCNSRCYGKSIRAVCP